MINLPRARSCQPTTFEQSRIDHRKPLLNDYQQSDHVNAMMSFPQKFGKDIMALTVTSAASTSCANCPRGRQVTECRRTGP